MLPDLSKLRLVCDYCRDAQEITNETCRSCGASLEGPRSILLQALMCAAVIVLNER